MAKDQENHGIVSSNDKRFQTLEKEFVRFQSTVFSRGAFLADEQWATSIEKEPSETFFWCCFFENVEQLLGRDLRQNLGA